MIEKLKSILNAGERPVMGIYLKILALAFLALSGLHFANMLGYGAEDLDEITAAANVANMVYAQFFAISAVGLWKIRPWGVACFFIATVSQLLLYWGFPEHFTTMDNIEDAFQGVINVHISMLAIFLMIRVKGK